MKPISTLYASKVKNQLTYLSPNEKRLLPTMVHMLMLAYSGLGNLSQASDSYTAAHSHSIHSTVIPAQAMPKTRDK